MKKIIETTQAPSAIGIYSQAVQAGNVVYFSGQIPLDPHSMQLVTGDFKTQVRQVFKNLIAVAKAAKGNLNDIVKLTIYLTDMENFGDVNTVMEEFFKKPYPARVVVAVKQLPKNAVVEIDAIMILQE